MRSHKQRENDLLDTTDSCSVVPKTKGVYNYIFVIQKPSYLFSQEFSSTVKAKTEDRGAITSHYETVSPSSTTLNAMSAMTGVCHLLTFYV